MNNILKSALLYIMIIAFTSCFALAQGPPANPLEDPPQAPPFSVIPVAEDDALVFAPGENAVLTARVTNESNENAQLLAYVRDFTGTEVGGEDRVKAQDAGETVVFYGVHVTYRIDTDPESTVGRGQTDVAALFDGEVEIALGELPEGFYMVEFSFQRDGDELMNRKYPLAVINVPEENEFEVPVIPLGVYTRFTQYRRTEEPIYGRTYFHYMAYDLSRHGINTFINNGGFGDGEIELFNRYGIAIVSRGGSELDHPGVIGTLHGDEPHPDDVETYKQRMSEIQEAHPGKAVTTCMVGEGIGAGNPRDPIVLWRQIEPELRMFRWYGIQRGVYGLLNPAVQYGRRSLSATCMLANGALDTPWWIVLPAFGGDRLGAYFRNPLPSEVSAMTHIAASHGAEGIFYYEHQHGIIDSVTLKHRDGKLEAIGEACRNIAANAELLQSLSVANMAAFFTNPVVRVVPLVCEDGNFYVYLTNKHPREDAPGKLSWMPVWSARTVGLTDVFTGEDVELVKFELEGHELNAADMTLAPGEGRLVRMILAEEE